MDYTFKIIVEECEEGGYYAECPAFRGCHVEGESYEETLSEMKAVIAGFIKEYIKNNQQIPHDNYSVASVSVAV
ncbi:MAG: type II toxin-antitoxin system HicB family antitoxin [Spirochaetales bacterium]|nr:type II toxin-antitoxin system HicB family antitoxin [Spirochaetales bacterium]